jgi:competence protein ComEC
MQFQLRVREVEVEGKRYRIDGGVLVRWTNPDRALVHGEQVVLHGGMLPTIQRVNHGIRGIEEHYRLEGVHSSIRIRGPGVVERVAPSPIWSVPGWASRMRQDLAERLVATVPEKALPFVLTVWLGDRQRIGGETYTTFVESGIAHILAVSGVHIGIIYITLAYGLRLLTKNSRYRIVVTLFAVGLFAFMAGARVSSLRAAIMVALYLSAEWFEREPDAPTALGLSALLFGVHNPDVIFTVGFQLSYLSIASLLLFRAPIADRLERFPRWAREGVSAVLAVQILPIPATILTFHLVSFGGFLANLVVIPLLSIVLCLSIATTFLSYIMPPLAPWFGHATTPVIWCIETIADTTASLRFSHLYLTSPAWPALLGYGAAVAGATTWIYGAKRPKRIYAVIAAGVCWCALFWKPWHTTPDITFLDVGHGDAAVVRTQDGKTVLIDGGNISEYVNLGRHVVGPYLWAHHISRVDAIFVSHTDTDHLGGLYYILSRFPVGVVYTAPQFGDNEEGRAFLTHCEQNGVEVTEVVSGMKIHIGDCVVQMLHPDAKRMKGLKDNDRSLVFRLESGGVSVLFTGDIEQRAEQIIFDGRSVSVDVVKVPHHGSQTSSTRLMLESVQARYAVVSSGTRGEKTLARPEVIQRYTDAGTQVYRTDYGGSIRVLREDGELRISRARATKNIAIR